jgi:hypothetical protein
VAALACVLRPFLVFCHLSWKGDHIRSEGKSNLNQRERATPRNPQSTQTRGEGKGKRQGQDRTRTAAGRRGRQGRGSQPARGRVAAITRDRPFVLSLSLSLFRSLSLSLCCRLVYRSERRSGDQDELNCILLDGRESGKGYLPVPPPALTLHRIGGPSARTRPRAR